MPAGRKRELQPGWVDDFAGALTSDQLSFEEVSSPRRRAAMDAAEPPLTRSCANSPSRTLIVVANDERTEPFSASQFHPPSSSCSPSRRATTPSTSCSKQVPNLTVRPLMHGSTSPLKNGCPACSQRQCALTSATARRTRSEDGSTPKSCNSWSVGSVAVQGWPWFSSRQLRLGAGKHAPPAHWPSSPCNASSLAPQPSVVTRARSASTTPAGAWIRSRNTCQRMAGSESSSHSSTVIGLSVTSG